MAGPPELRASDDDRERVAREIREHYAARTVGELDTLRADLPALPATLGEQQAAVAHRRAELQRRLLQQSGGAIVPFAICTGIWVAAGASGFFWPLWVALFTILPLLRNGWRLYGPAPELDRVEDELARRERGERHGPHGDRRRHRHGGGRHRLH
jgi:hypothetical protein